MTRVFTDYDNMDYLMDAIEKEIRRQLSLGENYSLPSGLAIVLDVTEAA